MLIWARGVEWIFLARSSFSSGSSPGSAKANGTKVGICGQGPSDYPDFAQFLVEEGIDTISVTPDSVLKTLKAISKIEQEIANVNA